jgi:phage shock protein PspC (stress-responsive transcriptional regulator)
MDAIALLIAGTMVIAAFGSLFFTVIIYIITYLILGKGPE